MDHINAYNEQIQELICAWVPVYVIAEQMGLFQALQAVRKNRPTIRLLEGLDGWETWRRECKVG